MSDSAAGAAVRPKSERIERSSPDDKKVERSASVVQSSSSSAIQLSLLDRRKISPVMLRTITGGGGGIANRNAVDWSAGSGLVAHGCGQFVVVVDPVSLQVAQVLDKHSTNVTAVAWTRAR